MAYKNKEDARACLKKFRIDNPEYDKQWREANKEKIAMCNKRWQEKNKEQLAEYQKQYRKVNAEELMAYRKQWQKKNKTELAKYQSNRYKTNIKSNINHKMRTAMGTALKGNKGGHHWEMLVGYTLYDLIKHLKRHLPKGYLWKDIFKGRLHIDHIIPMSAFNFTQPEHIDFKRCWALSNLRLLPARENIIKSNKLTKSFQPALAINEGGK